MFAHLKASWRELKNGKPGHRFRDRFKHRQESTKGRFNAGKIANIGLGLVLAVVGAIFLPAPGPGSIVLIMGMGLLGSEIQFIARFLDWLEVVLRKIIRQLTRYWQQASLFAKSAACLAAISTLGMAGYMLVGWYIDRA